MRHSHSEKKGGVDMSTIRARVRGGRLEPVEKLDLPEGQEVTITILDLPTDTRRSSNASTS